MSEQILNQILEKLNRMDEEQRQIKETVTRMEDEQQQIKQSISEISKVVADIPLIRQAVLETRDDIKRLEASLHKIVVTQNDHGYSIDILHREQLKIKTEIEKLKNQ